jgi:outer membrane protein
VSSRAFPGGRTSHEKYPAPYRAAHHTAGHAHGASREPARHLQARSGERYDLDGRPGQLPRQSRKGRWASLLLPVVSVNANYSKNTIEGTTTNLITGAAIQGKDKYDITGYGVQLTQPLFRTANFAAYAQGKISVSQADAELAIARQDLVLRAGQAYFDVLAAQDALDFARSEKAAIDGQLHLARRNSKSAMPLVDVHEAQARFDLAAAQEVSADSDLQSKQEALTTLIGRPAGGLARLTSKIGLPKPDPAEPEQWVKAAADQNLQIKVQEFLLAIADEEVNKTRGGHYPTLDLVASHGNLDQGGSALGLATDYTSNQIGVQLNVPIYQGGYVSSRVREAVARREQSRDSLTLTKRQTVRQTREAFLAVTSGAVRVQALEQAQVSSQKALESTLIGYESGVRTGVEVLNAQRELYRTKRDLSQARYTWLLSRLRLKLATGTLNEADLGEINALLSGV